MIDPPAETSLDQTLRLASQGDPTSWQRLVEMYSPRVFGLLVRRCGDRDLAEELTQATFVKLVINLQSFAGYEERGRFEPWLFRIAMNKLRDEMRRRRRQAVVIDMGPAATGDAHLASGWAAAKPPGAASEASGPAELISREEEHEQLRQAVKTLSEADQQVLYLRHTAGLSFAQIAETLGQPLGTVLARGHRALAKLRKKLDQVDAEQRSPDPSGPGSRHGAEV